MSGGTNPTGPAVQQVLDVGPEGPAPARGPWVTLCGDPAPYAIRRPTPKAPHRLEVLRCTRPASHAGPFHYHADGDARVIAKWGRDGRPDWPPVVPTPTDPISQKGE